MNELVAFLLKYWKVIGLFSLFVMAIFVYDKWLYVWDHIKGRNKE